MLGSWKIFQHKWKNICGENEKNDGVGEEHGSDVMRLGKAISGEPDCFALGFHYLCMPFAAGGARRNTGLCP